MLNYTSKQFILRAIFAISGLGVFPFVVGINPFRDVGSGVMYAVSMSLFIVVTVLIYRKLKMLEKQ